MAENNANQPYNRPAVDKDHTTTKKKIALILQLV